ncbi:hypothetical protein [Massilia sp. ST3]|uniref:hypothetical protein n=1 Tax=Massilia sp. ST3 TaxID=2824903 RepID=UPI001B82F116|nr:hypothetical protein [Massilia sp. ST3]MBQ5947041.1 hypothetical protein [Massilia sp. ST3]
MRIPLTLILAVATAGAAAAPLKLEWRGGHATATGACPEHSGEAIAAYRSGKFQLIGKGIDAVEAPKPPASPDDRSVPIAHLAPVGAQAVDLRSRLDGTSEILYLDCDKHTAYIAKRGGLADQTTW